MRGGSEQSVLFVAGKLLEGVFRVHGIVFGSELGIGAVSYTHLDVYKRQHVGLASEEGTGTRVILTFPHDRTRKELFGA